ncbi:hypothetical protein MIND_00400300 [Mycena indigotica]|uniref:Uncharacterized protein n=1 Tax=Mycena indigotica TaxID=2126181 RepID=A0A8H6T3K7_9AGAR|nr:uncharacterized protein MIND_00400300 [Mycena indigotica]KAF7310264.1 hypothetical protein MIND_00400300 [Mycena indigotica]
MATKNAVNCLPFQEVRQDKHPVFTRWDRLQEHPVPRVGTSASASRHTGMGNQAELEELESDGSDDGGSWRRRLPAAIRGVASLARERDFAAAAPRIMWSRFFSTVSFALLGGCRDRAWPGNFGSWGRRSFNRRSEATSARRRVGGLITSWGHSLELNCMLNFVVRECSLLGFKLIVVKVQQGLDSAPVLRVGAFPLVAGRAFASRNGGTHAEMDQVISISI